MLKELIKEFERLNELLEDGDDYILGMKQGVMNAMYIVDFRGSSEYFSNSDDLPF